MSLARLLIAGLATTMLTGTAYANNDDYYRCNDHYCYDDQADETRELNLRQLENPEDVTPPEDYAPGYSNDGQGGPYYEVPDQDDSYGPGSDDQDDYGPPDDPDNYDSPDDDDDSNGPPPRGDDQYPNDDQ